jgi:hypothetical protein
MRSRAGAAGSLWTCPAARSPAGDPSLPPFLSRQPRFAGLRRGNGFPQFLFQSVHRGRSLLTREQP